MTPDQCMTGMETVKSYHTNLCSDKLLLNLPPCYWLKTRVRNLESRVVETFYVPELEDTMEHHDDPGQPEEGADHDEHLGQEMHLIETHFLGHIM